MTSGAQSNLREREMTNRLPHAVIKEIEQCDLLKNKKQRM